MDRNRASTDWGWPSRALIWFAQSIAAVGAIFLGLAVVDDGGLSTVLLFTLGSFASGALLLRQASRLVDQELARERSR